MRKAILFIANFIAFHFLSYGQLNDNTWIIGYRYGIMSPVPALDFYFGNPDTTGILAPFDFFETNASICDDAGSLQLYTNGVYIANYNNQLVPGSASFNNSGGIISQSNLTYMNYSQCAIILPYPGFPNQYAIFHMEGNTFLYNGNYQQQPMDLMMSVVDLSLNGGQGQMTSVNQVAVHDTLLYSTMQAVKHANGRDWWITAHKYRSKIFYSILLTPSGISQVNTFTAGKKLSNGFNGQSHFSPDGTKYAIAYSNDNELLCYDFDRCTGSFSFLATLSNPDTSQNTLLLGCSFSPNSRYLYASNYLNLYQYDTWSSSIDSSRKLIAESDLFPDPFPSYFYRQALGQDNKIYMNCGNGTQHLHVINNPDLPDTTCNFVQHQLKIMNYQSSLPEFPNYRLGALTGSICDSLTGINVLSDEINIKVYPNPSFNYITIGGINEITKGSLIISDINGKSVLKKSLEDLKANAMINISSLPAGIYFYTIFSQQPLRIGKLIKLD